LQKIRKILLIIIISVFAVTVVKDQILKEALTVAVTRVAGAPVHIDGFSLGVSNPPVRICGFKIYNPKGFPRGILVDLPKINLAFDLGALFKGQIHLANAQIELKEIGLAKNSEGKFNLEALAVNQARDRQVKLSQQIPIQFDAITLGIGKIVLKECSGQKDAAVRVFDIDLRKSYKNVTSLQQLAALVLAEPQMKGSGIEGLKIHGAAMLAGIAVLPVTVAVTFIGKDSVQQDFADSSDDVFEASSAILKKMGRLTREDRPGGILGARINSTQVALRIRQKPDNRTELIVSARKYFFPEPEIAGGVLYEILEELK